MKIKCAQGRRHLHRLLMRPQAAEIYNSGQATVKIN